MRGAKCEVRTAKWELAIATAIANADAMPPCIRLPPSLYLLSPPLSNLRLSFSARRSPNRALQCPKWQVSSVLASFLS